MAKLLKLKGIRTEVHVVEIEGIKDYMVDIITNAEEGTYEAYIYTKNSGIKDFMLGCYMKNTTYAEFKSFLLNDIEKYIESFNEAKKALDDYYDD